MVMYFDHSSIFLDYRQIKTLLREKFDLTWTEYLVLTSVHKREENYGFVSTSFVITDLGLNKGWIYRAVNTLSKKNYLEIDETGNPWIANRISLCTKGNIRLASIDRLINKTISNLL